MRVGALLAAGAIVGAIAGFGAWWSAAGSCPGHDVPAFGSACGVLVTSLSWRVGLLAGVATVVMGLLAAGLQRTAEAMEDERRARADEASGDPAA